MPQLQLAQAHPHYPMHLPSIYNMEHSSFLWNTYALHLDIIVEMLYGTYQWVCALACERGKVAAAGAMMFWLTEFVYSLMKTFPAKTAANGSFSSILATIFVLGRQV